MSWSCGHHGYINADWLRKNQYPDASKQTSTSIEPSVAVCDIILFECYYFREHFKLQQFYIFSILFGGELNLSVWSAFTTAK